MPARVVRRRGNRQIAPADREGKSLSARGHEAGGDQRTQHQGDQQDAGNELASTAIEQSRAHGECLGAGVYRLSHVPRLAGTLPQGTAIPTVRTMRDRHERFERSRRASPPLCQSIGSDEGARACQAGGRLRRPLRTEKNSCRCSPARVMVATAARPGRTGHSMPGAWLGMCLVRFAAASTWFAVTPRRSADALVHVIDGGLCRPG